MDGDAQLFSRIPALSQHQPWQRMEDPVSPAPASDKGFDNPMFSVVSHPARDTGVLRAWAGAAGCCDTLESLLGLP